MDKIRQWWAQPDHYRWLSDYLRHRNLDRLTARMMAALVATLGVVPALLMFTSRGPDTPFGRTACFISVGACVAMAIMWLVRWPQRRHSAFFVATANACIAVTCLAQSSPETGLLGSSVFAALAGYVAFFHTAPYLTLVLSTGALTSLICAVRVAAAGEVLLAVAMLLIVSVASVAVPFWIQALVHLLGADVLKSHTDPLTGLRNRRGFHRSARALIHAGDGASSRILTVVMADLDRFKHLNDTHGHVTGDRVLVAVAEALRTVIDSRAVVARVGGEEFLVAGVSWTGADSLLGEHIRRAVASTPWQVTASVGVACMALNTVEDGAARSVIEHLVDAADTAMYEAKRAGGNQARHAGVLDPPPVRR